MILTPDIFIIPMTIALAAAPGAGNAVKICTLPKAPHVAVKVTTEEIVYDFSKSSRDLSRIQAGKATPYKPGTDTVSGGLREDHPSINTQIEWQVMVDQKYNIACMWYDQITILIKLQPKIYVAREFNVSPCREAVLQHEHRHVDADRIVLNKFASNVGQAVQKQVDRSAIVGPFKYSDVDSIKATSSRRIENVAEAEKKVMEQEMAIKQGQIDSLEEYESVSKYCQDIKVDK